MVLLHGTLDVHVHEGKDLPASIVTRTAGFLKRCICCNAGPELIGSCDPYLCLDVGNTRRFRSSFVRSTHNPVWGECADIYIADEADHLRVEVKDADVVGAEYLGQALLPIQEILGGQVFDGWLLLTDQQGKPLGHTDKLTKEFSQARVRLTVTYRPVDQQDVRSDSREVGHTYFPLRPGNRVKLYHDAVSTPGPVQGIRLANGGLYSESSCWDDIYYAILEAKRFIWITGWSVWDKTRLQRRPDREETSLTLGELLIQKAKVGVNVLLLVWDDTTNNMGLHPGLMATHDQETHQFFKDTEVTCILCPRQGGLEETYLQRFSTGNMFTHHQKTVILDAPLEGPLPNELSSHNGNGHGPANSRSSSGTPQRRVVAFVGGLDLCDGRYDRHDHPLFHTCQPGGVHSKDMHQACVDAFDPTKGCAREPWHDIHAYVEGPAAMDICLNFMERWAKQAGKLSAHKMRHLNDNNDIYLPEGYDVFTSKISMLKSVVKSGISMKVLAIKQQDPALQVKSQPAPEAWAVQLFRSIDSDSAEGFPSSTEGSYEAGLTVGKGKIIDASIHRAYINLVRGAKRYLYLENQYFLGSAHLWESDTETPCYNLVPAEITFKIVSKIRAGEPFRVYVVVPMFPEGVPTSGSVQAILHFETLTRRMMYRRIAAAIDEAGLTGQVHPQDYLQFFCLGKREAPETSLGMVAPYAELSASQVNLTPQDAPTGASTPGTKHHPTGTIQGQASLDPPDPTTAQGRCFASRRFMIYVHSKLMVVDDEYAIVGSANINQRSLDGSRDSEICIGAYQNGYLLQKAADSLPQGQVAGFRKALWTEHLHVLGPEHEDPSSLECMRSLRSIGDANWQAYVSPEVQPLPQGHLLNYPSVVGVDGSVSPLPGCEEFPDLGGKILGTRSAVLPGLLTA